MNDAPLILIVEENPRTNAMMVQALLGAGYRVQPAHDAMEGVRMAREEVPDLILADVSRSGQDNATAMSCLKDNPEYTDVPLILVSGLTPGELAQKMSECGAVDVIQKPFEPSGLISSVRHWLSASSGTVPAPEAPRKKAFEVTTREISPGVGELKIDGAIGISSLALVEAAFNSLFERKIHRILINLRDTKSVYSAGIGCFLGARDTAMQNGGDVVFVAIPPDLGKLFTMLGISRILRSAPTETAALADLASHAPPAAG